MISPIKTSINNNSQTSAQQKDSMFNSDTYSIPTNQKKHSSITKTDVAAFSAAGVSTVLLIKDRRQLLKYIKLIDVQPSLVRFSKMIKKLGNFATEDSLTHLGNKNNFNINAFKDYQKAMNSGQNFSIGMVDMDNFKSINEVFNHPTGDLFLSKIAQHIKQIAESSGAKAYRYGGEEFVITAINKKPEEMKFVMDSIAESIKNDNEIQKYLPEFKKNSQEQLTPLNNQINFVQHKIFDKFRQSLSKQEANEVRDNIKQFLNGYVDKFDPIDRTCIEEINSHLNNPEENLKEFLRADTKLGKETLKVHFDILLAPYKEAVNDLLKWTNNLERNKKFTISGGYKTLSPTYAGKFKSSDKLVNIADTSLHASKINGKNTMTETPDYVLNKLTSRN